MKASKLLTLILFMASTVIQAETLFYFPHYGDGAGLSMVFSFANSSETDARVNVWVYDSDGNRAELDYVGYGDHNPIGHYYIDLAPNGSRTFTTTGTSNPLKVGYVKVQSDNDNVTGVAIFQYAWGGETSILPVKPKKRFVLPFEKNSNLDLGLAIYREQKIPIDIELYNGKGDLVNDVHYNPSTYHSAQFSNEIFGENIPNSKGILVLSSEGLFAPMGLRFGNGVLAGLPVDEAKETSHYMAEKFCEPSGFWFFSFEYDSFEFRYSYSMYQVWETGDPERKYAAAGKDFWNQDITAGWQASENQMRMVAEDIFYNYIYEFNFTSDNEVEGSVRLQDRETGAIGEPNDMHGERFFRTPEMSE